MGYFAIPRFFYIFAKNEYMRNLIILSDKELEDLYSKVPKECKAYDKIMLEYYRLKGIPINHGAIL